MSVIVETANYEVSCLSCYYCVCCSHYCSIFCHGFVFKLIVGFAFIILSYFFVSVTDWQIVNNHILMYNSRGSDIMATKAINPILIKSETRSNFCIKHNTAICSNLYSRNSLAEYVLP